MHEINSVNESSTTDVSPDPVVSPRLILWAERELMLQSIRDAIFNSPICHSVFPLSKEIETSVCSILRSKDNS